MKTMHKIWSVRSAVGLAAVCLVGIAPKTARSGDLSHNAENTEIAIESCSSVGLFHVTACETDNFYAHICSSTRTETLDSDLYYFGEGKDGSQIDWLSASRFENVYEAWNGSYGYQVVPGSGLWIVYGDPVDGYETIQREPAVRCW